MSAVSTTPGITPDFVARLGESMREAEELRRLPADTVADLTASGFTDLLVPARFGSGGFDHDTSRELAGALTLGMKVSRTAMV